MRIKVIWLIVFALLFAGCISSPSKIERNRSRLVIESAYFDNDERGEYLRLVVKNAGTTDARVMYVGYKAFDMHGNEIASEHASSPWGGALYDLERRCPPDYTRLSECTFHLRKGETAYAKLFRGLTDIQSIEVYMLWKDSYAADNVGTSRTERVEIPYSP